jgi:hypothetical protein
MALPVDADSMAFAEGAYDIMTDNTPDSTEAKVELLQIIQERLQALQDAQ